MPDPVPLAQVKQILTEAAAQRTLPREALLAQAHAELFATLTVEETAKLMEELRALPHIDANMAVKLSDLLPQYPEEIRLLFSKERVPLDEGQVGRILEIIAQHR
jgi:DNA-directed RNA polymerase subunit F